MSTSAMTSSSLRMSLLAAAVLLAGNVSAQTYSKTEAIGYHDNTSKWVVGQTSSVSCTASIPISSACDGDVVSSTTYHVASDLPHETLSFGKLQSTMTYNADGTLATVKDGLNNTTTLSNWMRGIPRSITHADSTTQSAVVDDNGWIKSVTNELGATTNYGHDAMGRLASIAYPIGDTVVWASTNRSFVPVASIEYGIAAGHWRETVTTGNATKITYYDGLWRPLLVREYDADNQAATERFKRTAYGADGKVEFASYPSTSSNPVTGIWSYYDALGRVKSVSQDSELTLLTTTMTYENGFQTRVTNPRNQQTISTYLTYDQPTTDWPLVITAPESATTTITRDPHGKPLSLARSGGGVTPLTRYYAYNPHQELCKQFEPETRGSIFAYDSAGNLVQSASGLNAVTADSSQCNADQFAAGSTVTRAYNNRNRLTALTFPDGNGNQTWTYHADGLPHQVSTQNGGNAVTNVYTFNQRRLPIGESMVPDAVQTGWAMGYGYNNLGQVVTEAYPAGVNVTYSVNALGQTTSVVASSDGLTPSTVANGVSYFPNGALKQFNYGNGIVHTMAQNARQLPSRSTDGTVLDLGTTFDKNGNVTAITDYTSAARQTRSMVYDNLDRLTSTTSPMFGTAAYAYNTLDDLTQVNVSGGSQPRNHYYCYGAGNNRLLFVRSGPSCGLDASPAVQALEYDVQGNLRSKNGTTYTFDYGNRLRTTAGLTYRYDAQGRRVRQDSAGTQLKYSFYAQDGRLVWQRDEPASKRISNLYLAGSLIAEYSRVIGPGSPTITYQHTDALGSPIARTNSAGSVIETSEYEPYGKLLNRPNDDRAGYTGHVMDSASGLTYMQQRYYDPQIGRFLSVDPIAAYSRRGISFNRYWYANNNPYKFTDPDGRWVCNGGKENCGKFETALNRVADAAKSGRLSQSEQGKMERIVSFYGAKGDAKVSVSFASLGGPGGNASMRKDGGEHVTLDMGAATRNSENRTLNVLARVVAHEGEHGANDQQRGRPVSSLSERKSEEVSGYRAQAIYQKAANFAESSADGWTPYGGYNEGQIERQAQGSVDASCRGSAEGSCR